MSIRPNNIATERVGVNYVRSVVEGCNSVFKEIDIRSDYGHDAVIHLVDGQKVTSKEVAVQVKSGSSYCEDLFCKIPATYDHIKLWAEHDLTTLGVVYEPKNSIAYWVDLQTEAKKLITRREKHGSVIRFKKSEWNTLNDKMFLELVLPTLLGEAPRISIEMGVSWAKSTDCETHDIGVRTILARYRNNSETWDAILEIFQSRSPEDFSVNICLSLARMMGHDDIGYYSGQIDEKLRETFRPIIRNFGPASFAKLLFYVDDYGFERPSIGYSLLPIFASSDRSRDLIEFLSMSDLFPEHIRIKASNLLRLHDYDPEWWALWRR